MNNKFLTIIGFTFLAVAAVFFAACNNVTTTETAETSNKAVVINSANTNVNAPVTTDAAKAFTVDFKSEPAAINAGTPVVLSFTVKDKQGAIVKDLSIVHEKPMHLLIVSSDLAEFYHIHPEQQEADGSFKVAHVFPNGGNYRLYADFTPQNSAQIVEQLEVKVAGQERAAVPLVPDEKLEKTVDGLRVVMTPGEEIKAGKELMLNFTMFDEKTNKPAADLQNYLGALAHFVIISQDLQKFVHAHPMSKDEKMGDMNMNGKVDESKPHVHDDKEELKDKKMPSPSEVSAHTSFPQAGLFKVFAQFQRAGKVITVPFTVNVKAGDAAVKPVAEVQFPADAKKVIVSKNGFEPSTISFKKGEPLKLAFYRTDSENCANEVVFKDLNMTTKLPVGELVTVELKDLKNNEVSFACGMDMLKGKVIITQ